jgi:hypothetical protein
MHYPTELSGLKKALYICSVYVMNGTHNVAGVAEKLNIPSHFTVQAQNPSPFSQLPFR